MRRKLVVAAGAVLTLLLCTGAAGVSTVDHWLFVALDPGPFDPARTPAAPDYTRADAWAALPEMEDGADVAVAEWPAIDQRTAPADVFYVHPTTWVGAAWNAPFDDPAVVEATERGGTRIQASVFNACCAVYAPRYRQANGRAYIHPDERSARAYAVAFDDVSRAFDAFLERNGDRPFIVAGHSQGSMLAARLVRERVAGTELEERLVVATLIGGNLGADDVGLPVCARATQTGCVVGFNARAPGYVPGGLEFAADDPDTMRRRLCVNPSRWDDPAAHAPASDNLGALFLDTEAPVIKPGFADARCVDGALVVTAIGDPERDLPSRVLLWMMGPGNYHPIEYQLFYGNLRVNVNDRVDAWLGAQPR